MRLRGRVGLSCLQNRFEDASGVQVVLGDWSEKAISHKLLRDLSEKEIRIAADTAHIKNAPEGVQSVFEGGSLGHSVWMEPIRPAYRALAHGGKRGKRAQATSQVVTDGASEEGATGPLPCDGPKAARIIFKYVSGGLITGSVLHKWRYNVDPVCETCGRVDTAFHRVFQCSRITVEERKRLLPRNFSLPIIGGPGSADALRGRGIVPRPRPIFEPPDGVSVVWTVGAANFNSDPSTHEVVSARIQEAFVDHCFPSRGAQRFVRFTRTVLAWLPGWARTPRLQEQQF